MSEKMSNSSNSFKMNNDPAWVKAASVDTSVKLAGEEAKDRLYEPKHKKKLVRVLTVVAYVFFVSLAGIMLSLYYVFLWNGYPKEVGYSKELNGHRLVPQIAEHDCRGLEELQDFEDTSKTFEDTLTSPIPTNDSREDMSTGDNDMDLIELSKQSLLYKKLFYKNIVMA